jgi:outer membrane protein OmpA-like peptidoglycan-associated protein
MVDRSGRCGYKLAAMTRRLPAIPLLLSLAGLAGCVQTGWQSTGGMAGPGMATADQMMDVEASDRIARFRRLARLDGIVPPQIDQMMVPAYQAGADRPVPVIRIVFEESDFFASGSAVPRPQAAAIMNVIAENMRHDVPDVRLTVLGHTDAVGTDATNVALSQQRALNVLQILVDDGVNPGQLGTVAIGKAQPIAPNETTAGRARNRRVEFLISASEPANLFVVATTPVNAGWLRVASGATRPVAPTRSAEFLKPHFAGPADFAEAPLDKRQIAFSPVKEVPIAVANTDTGSPLFH